MFCPSCGTRNPDGSRFCGSCGTDLSARGAAAPQVQSGARAFARPAAAARGRSAGRALVVAGIAAAVTVALVVAVGLRTNWFGLARPHLVPGTYTISGSATLRPFSRSITVSISQDDHVSLVDGMHNWVGEAQVNRMGNARVSWAGRDHLYVQVPITTEDGQSKGDSFNLVIPQGAPDSIVGPWASWFADKDGKPYARDLEWAKVEDDGTLRFGRVYSGSAMVVAESLLKAGTFQGDANAMLGTWARQGDGSYQFFVTDNYNNDNGSYTSTFQYHK